MKMTFPAQFLLTIALSLALTPVVEAQAPPSASAVDSPAPKQNSNCRPRYPAAALRSGAQGETVLSFHLDESGKIASGKVVRSSGPPENIECWMTPR